MKLITFMLLLVMITPVLAIDTISESQSIVSDSVDKTYILTPEPYQFFKGYFKNSASKEIVMEIFDDEELLYRVEIPAGVKKTFFYVFGKDVDGLTLQISAWDSSEGTYILDLKIESQNDAESGQDAPLGFRNGLPIELGVHEGFLGGDDKRDFYKIDLLAQERIDMVLTPKDKASLGLLLIDAEFINKIDTRAQLEGEELITYFTSPRAQTVYIGIEGSESYTFSITSDLRGEKTPSGDGDATTGVNLPPPPPEFPEPVNGADNTDKETDLSGITGDDLVAAQAKEKDNTLLVVLVVLFILVVGGFGFQKFIARPQAKEDPVLAEKKAVEKEAAQKKAKTKKASTKKK